MAKATLTIARRGQSQVEELDPEGMILGRHPQCDILLDSGRVSRRHARIYRDPFGRWVVEDLGSKHGVRVGEERIEARAILPGECFTIGPFTLTLNAAIDRQIAPDPTATETGTVLEDDPGAEIIPGEEEAGYLGRAQIRRLNEISDSLSHLSSARELYSVVCGQLAGPEGGMAAVLRLPGPMHEFTGKPEVLASRFGGGEDPAEPSASGNVHLSRRVLEAVRTRGRAVLASSKGQSQNDLMLTIVDQNTPRKVFCSPICEPDETVDVLYLDVPSERAAEGTLDFIQAVARQVDLARRSLLFAEERAERRVLDQQLALAREIQTKLIPIDVGPVAGLDLSICYRPAMWVGGDYCDTWRLADGRVAFTVADVCGKGLPAAMIMSNLQAALRTTTAFCADPAEIMRHVNQQMSISLPDGLFVTLFLGVFDPRTGRLEYVNAGHLLPVEARCDGIGKLGRPTNQPIGVHQGEFTGQSEQIPPGTGLVVYTDGITETADAGGAMFGVEGILHVLADRPASSAAWMVQTILEAAQAHRHGLPPQDDITVLALLYQNPNDTTSQTVTADA